MVQLGTSAAAGYCGLLLTYGGAEVVVVDPEDLPADAAAAAVRTYLGAGKGARDLDLANESGRAELRALLAGASCLIADRTLPELAELGLAIDRATVAANSLVVVCVTPWGSEGPAAMREASDLHMFHAGGLGAITPRFANNPDEPPLRTGYPLSEYLLGLNAAVAAMAGLNHLRETGEGSVIDVSGQQAIAHASSIYFAAWSYEHRRSSRVSRPGLAPFHFLPCRDGHIMIICPEEHQWRALVELMGNPEWAQSELFETSVTRALYWDAIEPELVAWMADKTRDELYHLAQEKRVPLAPVNNVEAVLASEHLANRGFFVPLPPVNSNLMAPGRAFKQQSPLA
ncbi:MAG: CoA transferase [Dehalococcoidia bacterium]